MQVRYLPAGDTAVIVEFGDVIERAVSDRVLQLGTRVRSAAIKGVVETVPTFRSLLIRYDPLLTGSAIIIESVRTLLDDFEKSTHLGRLWHMPACYAQAFAPDLDAVADATGLTAKEVIALHSETQFHVYMIGFLPGFSYMGDLPEALRLPRRADPRVRVPAGSMAIASTLTVIYTAETPGGWHLIGATPIRLFDLRWKHPFLLTPGDAVRFEPVAVAEYESIQKAVAKGEYLPQSQEIAA